jgi:hypothetical protein
MGAAVIWSYLELFGDARIAKAVFVDQAPLQASACRGRRHRKLSSKNPRPLNLCKDAGNYLHAVSSPKFPFCGGSPHGSARLAAVAFTVWTFIT